MQYIISKLILRKKRIIRQVDEGGEFVKRRRDSITAKVVCDKIIVNFNNSCLTILKIMKKFSLTLS